MTPRRRPSVRRRDLVIGETRFRVRATRERAGRGGTAYRAPRLDTSSPALAQGPQRRLRQAASASHRHWGIGAWAPPLWATILGRQPTQTGERPQRRASLPFTGCAPLRRARRMHPGRPGRPQARIARWIAGWDLCRPLCEAADCRAPACNRGPAVPEAAGTAHNHPVGSRRPQPAIGGARASRDASSLRRSRKLFSGMSLFCRCPPTGGFVRPLR